MELKGIMYQMFQKNKELCYNSVDIDIQYFIIVAGFVYICCERCEQLSILVLEMLSSHFYTKNQVKNIFSDWVYSHPSQRSDNFFGMFKINNYLKKFIF